MVRLRHSRHLVVGGQWLVASDQWVVGRSEEKVNCQDRYARPTREAELRIKSVALSNTVLTTGH